MTMFYELVHEESPVAASTSLATIKDAYAKAAKDLLGRKFGSYDEARSFIFEAGLQDTLYIRAPEYKPSEDEPIIGPA